MENNLKAILQKIFLFLLIFIYGCKPQINFENGHQNEKSDSLMGALDSYIKKENLTIGWLSMVTKNCLENSEKITQSNCINLIIDTTKEKEPTETISKLAIEISRIDTKTNKNLSGVYVTITAVNRKKDCEAAPITVYSVRKCFNELNSQLIKLKN